MAYDVEISARAEFDLDRIVAWIARDSVEHAIRWRERLERKIEGFRLFPHGCSLAAESERSPVELRQAIFGNYRIVFTVREESNVVFIVTIRHAARRNLTDDELDRIVTSQ